MIFIVNALLCLFLLNSFFSCGSLSNTQVVEKIREFALEGRSPLLSAHDRPWSFADSFKQASLRVSSILPNVGEKESIKGCVAATVTEIAEAPLGEMKLVQAGAATGLSGNEVFIISSPTNNTPVFIAKAFKKSTDFTLEIAGISIIENLNLKNSQAINLKALARCETSGTDFDIILETFAPGVSIHHIVSALTPAVVKGSLQHKSLLDNAILSVEKLASALSELHSAHKVKRNFLNPTIKQDFRMRFASSSKNLQKISELAEGINFALLESTFEDALAALESSNLIYGVTHGDAHLGNFIYDSSTKSLVMIDLDRVAYSESLNNEALGLPAIDYLRVNRSFALAEIQPNGISHEDADALRAVFKNRYQEKGGTPPTLEELALIDLYMMTVHVPPEKDPAPRELFIKYMCKNYPVPGGPKGVCTI